MGGERTIGQGATPSTPGGSRLQPLGRGEQMKIDFHSGGLGELEVDLLAVSAFEDALAEARPLVAIDEALDGLLTTLREEEGFEAKEDQTLLVHTQGRIKPKRILVIGLGKRQDFLVPETRRYASTAIAVARSCQARSLAATLPAFDALATERATQFLVEGVLLSLYRFDRHLSEERRRPAKLATATVVLPDEYKGVPPHLAASRAQILAEAVVLARDLTNQPANELTPTKLAECAAGIAKDRGLECKILTPREIERSRMRLLLAVAGGSDEEPRFIHLTYRPKGKEKAQRKIVLVGKGVTFDSGGLSLKQTANMVDMKGDMAGAAAVLGAISAVPSLGLKCEVHALIAATENMVSGAAYRVGDIIAGINGKSVEIVNTDAEGRLTMADALCYGVKLKPDELIDVATLTGACMVALGPHTAGVMGTDYTRVEHFMAAARRAGEDMWHLPLPKRLKSQLESPIADLKNSGERWGGALTAGLFLQEFVDEIPWIHVDIAGPSFAEKEWAYMPRGGTGFGVATLVEYLSSRDG